MTDLTVIILTKNEENNLPKCVASLKEIAKRIVIVDCFSEDKTVEVAKSLGCDVYENPWVNYATQLNWALENTDITTKWTMRMDADEEILPELSREINEVLPTLPDDVNGVELRRRVYFLGRWIRHGGVYPTIMLRIFKTGFCTCEQTIMDEHMILTEGKTICLKNDFIDYNTKSLEWWTGKHNWYSDREVMDYLDKQRQMAEDDVVKPKLFGNQAERKRFLKYILYYKTPLMRRAHWYYLYRYYLRGGFLDGTEGKIFHFLQGYWYRFLVDAKIYEHGKKAREK